MNFGCDAIVHDCSAGPKRFGEVAFVKSQAKDGRSDVGPGQLVKIARASMEQRSGTIAQIVKSQAKDGRSDVGPGQLVKIARASMEQRSGIDRTKT